MGRKEEVVDVVEGIPEVIHIVILILKSSFWATPVAIHFTPVDDSVGQSIGKVSTLATWSPASLFYLDPDLDHFDFDLEPFHAFDLLID